MPLDIRGSFKGNDVITSTANESIKLIRKLRDRKYREQTSSYFIEGIRIVYDALKTGQIFEKLIYAPELIRNETGRLLVEEACQKGVSCMEVSKEVYLSLSQKEGSQGVGAVLAQKWTKLEDLLFPLSGVWIGLHEVADPGNLGTIMRTADAVGAAGILLVGNCTDPYDPTALRASMGGIYSLQLVKINKDDFVRHFSKKETIIVGTSDSADLDYREEKYPTDMILLMGSEREGLGVELSKVCSQKVKIPMRGRCDSLNLSVATGIVLYEILYQNQQRINKG